MEQKAIDLKAADNVRLLAAAMVEKAKSGHPGGAMGGADFVHVLYSEFLKFDPNDPEWDNRDRFFLDPGHMSPMLYSILTLINKFSLEDIKNFRQWGSVTPGHPERDIKRLAWVMHSALARLSHRSSSLQGLARGFSTRHTFISPTVASRRRFRRAQDVLQVSSD